MLGKYAGKSSKREFHVNSKRKGFCCFFVTPEKEKCFWTPRKECTSFQQGLYRDISPIIKLCSSWYSNYKTIYHELSNHRYLSILPMLGQTHNRSVTRGFVCKYLQRGNLNWMFPNARLYWQFLLWHWNSLTVLGLDYCCKPYLVIP